MTALVDWRLCGDRPQVIDRSDYGDTSDWDFDIRCGDVRVAVGVCAKCLTPTATINTWRANAFDVATKPAPDGSEKHE